MFHLRQRQLVAVVMLALSALGASGDAAAAWPHAPGTNLAIANGFYTERPIAMCPDGAGGAIIAWYTYYYAGTATISVQRVDAAGRSLWGPAGTPIVEWGWAQEECALVPDNAGGATIFTVTSYIGSRFEARRIDSSGVVRWATDVNYTGYAYQGQLVAVADAQGRSVVAWRDDRNGNADIYAQCLSATGAPQWAANGVRLTTSTDADSEPAIASDGQGGLFVAWRQQSAMTGSDIRLQRVFNGASQWSAGGVLLTGTAGEQTDPELMADTFYGVFATWQDTRSGNADIHATRVNGYGYPVWASETVVCSAAGDQTRPRLATDTLGGAIIVWQDQRNTDMDIYTQRISAAGVAQWTANGVVACSASGGQEMPAIVADGMGGAVVAWSDYRTGNGDIYAQRISTAGAWPWLTNGQIVSNAPNMQYAPLIASGEGAATVVAWSDYRSGTTDAYAQRLDEWGLLGAEPVITSVRDVPNDQGGKVKVSWLASPLDTDPLFRNIEAYIVFRSVPPLASKSGRLVTRDAGQALQPGAIYATGTGDKIFYWEFVASQTAYRLAAYSYLAPTTGDSLAGSNPRAAFLIEARVAGGSRWWTSEPDSGYSVDNLAPRAPVFLASRFEAGAVRVRWSPNAEADLAGYRLYSGDDLEFIPGPATLVTAVADTGFVDVGALPYTWYKLTALDTHGNESVVATLTPQQISDVPGGGVSARARLVGAVPNPFNPATAIVYHLERPEAITLSIYDTAGRLVRALVRGPEAPGRHEVRWDGTDLGGRAMASGVYFCRLTAGEYQGVARLTLVR